MARKKFRRHSTRLPDYDYSEPGMYFVTVCTFDRRCILGSVINGEITLNEYGGMVRNEWLKTALLRPNVKLDEFVVMPNHLHGIVTIVDHRRRGVLQYAPTSKFWSPSQTIGAIVRGFKSSTTKRINELRNTPGVSVWQRNYYEHVIRDENDLHQIRQYIQENPLKWDLDPENPFRRAVDKVIKNHSSTFRHLAG